jgi:hypothetical protein
VGVIRRLIVDARCRAKLGFSDISTLTGKTTVILRVLAACLALVVAAFSARADAPRPLWELAGFDAPKSVLYDARSDSYFVSNVNGDPTTRDGNGYIAQVSSDGRLLHKIWFPGLNAPKGMAIYGDYLFVADIDQLVVIHKVTAKLMGRHPALPSKYLSDVAVDALGRVYVSDMLDDTIYRLQNGVFDKWVESAALMGPNALKVVKDELWVAGWGRIVDGFKTTEPGHIVAIDLETKELENVGQGYPIGNLDGLEPIGGDRFLATDWVAGGLLLIDQYGRPQVLADLPQGSGDMGFNPLLKQVVVPLMADGKIVAYQFD